MFVGITNITVEVIDFSKLKLKAGNSCFRAQDGQNDASPSMLADSLLVLRQCRPSKTNKAFKVKLNFEGLPCLLKGQQNPKDLVVMRLKCRQLQRNLRKNPREPMRHLHEINVVSGKVYYTFRVTHARD